MTYGTMALGRTVKMFLVDGHVGGLVTAEVMNWTGHVVTFPRSLLPRLKTRPEAERTGIYLLLGEDNGNKIAYIGETDEMYTRLAQHAKDPKQDFFERVVVITSTSDALTKAHARRLEHLAHERASLVANYLLQGNKPYNAKLPESDATDMLSFFEQIDLVLPVLGIDLLQLPSTKTESAIPEDDTADKVAANKASSKTDDTIYEINSPKQGVHATAREINGEFVVLSGSLSRVKAGAKHGYEKMRQDLEANGKLVPYPQDPRVLQFAVDVPFRSPSAAAAAVFNRSSNGRLAWRVKGSGKTYDEHESERLD